MFDLGNISTLTLIKGALAFYAGVLAGTFVALLSIVLLYRALGFVLSI